MQANPARRPEGRKGAVRRLRRVVLATPTTPGRTGQGIPIARAPHPRPSSSGSQGERVGVWGSGAAGNGAPSRPPARSPSPDSRSSAGPVHSPGSYLSMCLYQAKGDES